MKFQRRCFLAAASGALIAPALSFATSNRVEAIAFDAFPIFDPRSLTKVATELFGNSGQALVAQWSEKLFGYTWIETAAGQYQDFRKISDQSLRYTAAAMKIELSDHNRNLLVDHYDQLDTWPDVKPALRRLQNAGIRLRFLSNQSNDAAKQYGSKRHI